MRKQRKRTRIENEYIEQSDYCILRIYSSKYGSRDFLIDKDQVEKCKKYHWTLYVTGRKQRVQYYYASVINGGETILLHRYLTNCLKGMLVDHINRNTLDNELANLRIVTKQENCINRGTNFNNTSGVKGVTWNKREDKWMAFIHINNNFKNLGYYDDLEKAKEARKNAEQIRLMGFENLCDVEVSL